MKNITLKKKWLTFVVALISFAGFAQVPGASFTIGLSNITSNTNTLEFDLMMTLNGPVEGIRFSGITSGINFNSGILNGGSVTLTYLGERTPAINGIVINTLNTATVGHIRIVGSPLTPASSIDIPVGTYKIGRYRLTNTTTWTSNSDTQFWFQPVVASGRSNNIINAVPFGQTSGGAYAYTTIAPSNDPGVGFGTVSQTTPISHILNASAQDCATVGTPVTTAVTCFEGADGSATITMSNLTPSVAAITYTIDGGAALNATLVNGAFTISGLEVGSYSVVVSNAGCPNVTVSVTVNGPTTPLTNVTTQTACDSFVWDVTGLTYTASGTYTGTSTNLQGCTVEETLNLTITPGTNNTTTISACDSYTWSVNATTYTASGTYTSVSGCDTETLVLTITPSTNNTTTISACDSYTWSVNATTYTASGTYTSVSGCNTETLVLTITPSTNNTTTISACDSYTWSVNATTYTASGTYTSVSGCNTETLVLTITPSTNNTTTISACDSYTWSVNATTYTASGTYTSVSGCNTETLVLTIITAVAPTGDSVQTVAVDDLNEATLADLIVSPLNVVWYASLSDAQNQVNPLDISTVLTNGATYYAVAFASGCASTPLAVTVTVTLGVDGFDNDNFKFYPNPTAGIFNVSYSDEITSVTVINLLGQTILTKQTNFNQVEIDLTSLPSATYFVKVESNGKSRIIKVIKKD